MNPNGGVEISKFFSKDAEPTQDQQYLELCASVKCVLKPSPIHGIGVFALRDIKQGEHLYCDFSVPPKWYTLSYANLKKFDMVYPEIKEMILARWPQVINGSKFMSPNYDQRLTAFINHSEEPNYDQETDLALRDIAKGEEITEDYRIVENWYKVFPWIK